MKLLHTADWHLGKVIYGRSLLEDQKYFIEACLLPLLEQEQPDAILLAGDVFDRPVAPVEAISLFDAFLKTVNAMGIQLLGISGNHDSAERMAPGSALLRKSGVYLSTTLKEAQQPVTLNDNTDVYLLPYFDPAQARDFLQDDTLRGFYEAYAAVLARMKQAFRPGVRNILVAHCFVMGSALSASESPTFVGGSSEVSADVFEGFDCVALGHLHAPQRAGKNGRYAGSPLKYSFDEANHKKSVTILEEQDGVLQTRQVPIVPKREMRVLSDSFEALYEQAKANPSEDYFYLNLKDEHPVYMPVDRLRPYYPNLLGLQSEWLAHTGNGENDAIRAQMLQHKLDDTMILKEFLKQICGVETTEQDRTLFLQALKQAEEVQE